MPPVRISQNALHLNLCLLSLSHLLHQPSTQSVNGLSLSLIQGRVKGHHVGLEDCQRDSHYYLYTVKKNK